MQVILDKSNRSARYSSADFLVHHGIATRIDAQHAIAHNKVMIIDRRTLITGSFNFTQAAEHHNAENLLVLDSPALAKRYLDNWERHAAHSEPYPGTETGAAGPENRTIGPWGSLAPRDRDLKGSARRELEQAHDLL